MSYDVDDIAVSRKLDSIEPLAAGIVYGREEAWDKLQARMEGKKAIVLPFRYKAAAAAALLLLLAGVLFLLAGYEVGSEQKIVNNQKPQPVPAPTVVTPAPAPVVPVAPAVAMHTAPVHEQHIRITVPAPIILTSQKQPVAVHDEAVVAEPGRPQPAPEAARMRTVHINQMDGTVAEDAPPPAATMPVVVNATPIHINEFIQYDNEMNTLRDVRQHHQVIVWSFPLGRRPYPVAEPNNEIIPDTHLKIKIN
jgi:hypothetical protein